MTPIRRILLPRPMPRGRALRAAALLAVGLLGLLSLAGPAPATDVQLSPTPLDSLPDPDVTIDDAGVHLSLDDAVTIALRRNLGLVVERYNWIQRRHGVLQSLGIYDLGLFGSARHQEVSQPTSQGFEGVSVLSSTSEAFQLSLQQLVPTGGVAELTTSASKVETNSRNATLNPSFQARTDLTFTQPILRNFGLLQTERNILIARARASQTREAVEQEIAQTIQDVESAYWDLVAARNQLGVAQEALKLANTLHEQNKVRVDVGTLAPLELVQSEAGIAGREEDIIRAEAAIGDAADRLRQLLNLDQGRLWEVPIVPETDPAAEKIAIDVDDAIQTALDQRPEIAAELDQLESLNIDKKYFRLQVLPQLDLVLNYNLYGLAGDSPATTNPFTGDPIPATSGNYSDAFDQVKGRDFDSWSVQLQVSYPLQNRQRREQNAIADLAVEQEMAVLQDLRTQIITQVRTAARAVETAAKQIDSAKVSRQLEEKNLDAERKRYENGMSSSFRVLQIQEDLTQARSREVTAVTTYRTALARYYRSIGRLLEQKGVELDEGAFPKGSRFGLASLFHRGE